MMQLIRAGSERVAFDNARVFEAAEPALVRRHSNPTHKIQINVNLNSIPVPEEDLNNVVIDTGAPEEEEPAFHFCKKTHKCGHACRGVLGERKCLPCLNTACAEKSGLFEGINEDELCGICYTTELGSEACTKLSCGHVFHTNCLVQLLQHKWPTLRVTFGFMACPSCNQELKIEGLSKPVARELGPLIALKKQVEREALKNAESQGILSDERLQNPNDVYYNKPQEYANHRCSFYQCAGCQKPYFGGLIDCEQEAANNARDTKKEDLLCQDCLLKEIGAGTTHCEKHGKAQIDWKCMYCCSTALFCCFGTHYMCEPCHDEYNRTLNPPLKDCHGINCPLGIAHPPPSKNPREGGVFPLGCGICRSEKLEILQNRDVQQVVSADKVPKFWNKWEVKPAAVIIRPEVEIELPAFIAQADEILQAYIEKLNRTPVPILSAAQ